MKHLMSRLILILATSCVHGCGGNGTLPPDTTLKPIQSFAPTAPLFKLPERTEVTSTIRFADVTKESGIDFTYYGSPSAERYMTEQNGGGIALFDYDGDGLLDVLLTNGSHFQKRAESIGVSQQLYRGVGDCAFNLVTGHAGLMASGFGMGCSAGDFDNDGFNDLFVKSDQAFLMTSFSPIPPIGWSCLRLTSHQRRYQLVQKTKPRVTTDAGFLVDSDQIATSRLTCQPAVPSFR